MACESLPPEVEIDTSAPRRIISWHSDGRGTSEDRILASAGTGVHAWRPSWSVRTMSSVIEMNRGEFMYSGSPPSAARAVTALLIVRWGDFGTAIPVELGLGYTMTSTARLEVLVEYRPAFAFRGRANFLSPESRQSVAADLSSFAGMVAAYIDLPGAGVPKIGPFGRFVGGRPWRCAHPDRADPHDVSGDDDDRSGRGPDGSCMDGDSGGGGGAGRAG